jgi:hypothetical protein
MDVDGILLFVFILNQFKISYFGTLWNIVFLILLCFVSSLFLTFSSPFFDSYLQSGNSLLYIFKNIIFNFLFVRHELNLHMYVYLLAFFQFYDIFIP